MSNGNAIELVLGIFHIVCNWIYLFLRMLMPKMLVSGVPRVLVPKVLVLRVAFPKMLVPLNI